MITDAPAYHPGAVSEPEESEYLCYVLMRKEAAAKPGARGYPICIRRNGQTSAPSGVTWTLSASHARNVREGNSNNTRGIF